MCGILYGRLKNSGKITAPDFERAFKAGLARSAYRGPNASGFHRHGAHYFGHHRLSVIHPGPEADQPTVDDAGVSVFNGEIYNYQDFGEHPSSDTLTLHRILNKDPGRVKELSGPYAFVHLNVRTGRVTVGRDGFGEKPLYGYQDAHLQLFSSTIKPIREIMYQLYPGRELTINPAAVDDYLLFGYIREPHTIYEEVTAHQPGFLPLPLWGPGGGGTRVSAQSATSAQHPTDYLVAASATTDVKPTLLLSSGKDSTYILGRLTEAAIPVDVAVYQHPEAERDESIHAREYLQRIAPGGEATVCRNELPLADIYTRFVSLLEQPSHDGLDLLNLLIGLRRKDPGGKVILTGIGGDELYGGYPQFKRLGLARLLRIVARFPGLPDKYRRFEQPKNRWGSITERYAFAYRLDPVYTQLLGQGRVVASYGRFLDGLATDFPMAGSKYRLDELRRCEVRDYLRNQLLRDGDNIAMHLGYELRCPLLAPAALHYRVDYRAHMTNWVGEEFGITFRPKRGFSYGEDRSEFDRYYAAAMPGLLGRYPRFSPLAGRIGARTDTFAQRKKLLLLLLWLTANESLG